MELWHERTHKGVMARAHLLRGSLRAAFQTERASLMPSPSLRAQFASYETNASERSTQPGK